MLEKILQDALFSAIAAIGFAAISRPPARAYIYCAAIAAVGHAIRFMLMTKKFGICLHIVPASLIAAFAIGVLAVIFSPVVRTPPETCLPCPAPDDSGNVCISLFCRSGNVCAEHQPGGIQPLFLSIRIQHPDMHMYSFKHGSGSNFTRIFV